MNVLDLIGNTPLVEVARMEAGPCSLYLKLEHHNPGGSIKDRIALSMIEDAERQGKIKPGSLIVEATAGNTGLGLALVAALKGYRLLIVVPDKMSQEKIFHLRAMGAEIVMARSDVTKGHPEYYQERAADIARRTPGAFYINQFANPANPRAHEETTGPEIWEQMDHDVDAVVAGVGTGGTITGLANFFAQASPQTEIVLADPQGSVLAKYIETGKLPSEVGSWLVEGIGEDFIPPNCDLARVKTAYEISDAESFITARELLRKEGILGGSSSGTLLAAALKYCREQKSPKRVVTFVCDSGNKYLSKMYNDFWMFEQGLLDRPQQGNLVDLIVRRYQEGSTVTVSPNDSLTMAYRRMKLYDVSQLPVMEGDRLAGILDESDLLVYVGDDPKKLNDAVAKAMVREVETIAPKAPLSSLLPVFQRDHVAVVADQGRFIGLITRIDFLNHLRKQMH